MILSFTVLSAGTANAQYIKMKPFIPWFAGVDVRNNDAVVTTGYSFYWNDNVMGPWQGFYQADLFLGHGLFNKANSLNIAFGRSVRFLRLRFVGNINYHSSDNYAYAVQPQIGIGVPALFEFYMGYNAAVSQVGEMSYNPGLSFTFNIYIVPGIKATAENMKETYSKGSFQRWKYGQQ